MLWCVFCVHIVSVGNYLEVLCTCMCSVFITGIPLFFVCP